MPSTQSSDQTGPPPDPGSVGRRRVNAERWRPVRCIEQFELQPPPGRRHGPASARVEIAKTEEEFACEDKVWATSVSFAHRSGSKDQWCCTLRESGIFEVRRETNPSCDEITCDDKPCTDTPCDDTTSEDTSSTKGESEESRQTYIGLLTHTSPSRTAAIQWGCREIEAIQHEMIITGSWGEMPRDELWSEVARGAPSVLPPRQHREAVRIVLWCRHLGRQMSLFTGTIGSRPTVLEAEKTQE